MFKKKPVEKRNIISHNEVNVDNVFKTNPKMAAFAWATCNLGQCFLFSFIYNSINFALTDY